MSTADADRSSEVFAALGDPTRLALLRRLATGEEASIAHLSAGGTMTRQAVAKHLRVLEQARLVESRRHGRETRFVYRPNEMIAARGWLDAVSRQWDDALGRLKSLIEGEG